MAQLLGGEGRGEPEAAEEWAAQQEGYQPHTSGSRGLTASDHPGSPGLLQCGARERPREQGDAGRGDERGTRRGAAGVALWW